MSFKIVSSGKADRTGDKERDDWGMKKKKAILIAAAVVGLSLLGSLGAGVYYGLQFMGPFRYLNVVAVKTKYPPSSHQGDIVFYGASNFRLWAEMDEDMLPYRVQNHGIGGAADKDLVAYSEELLFPYDPSIVFFQTGSNDYVQSTAPTDEQRIAEAMEYKAYMFDHFHERLPNAEFVVMGGLLLPGRSEYTDMTKEINRQLAKFCEERDYMTFVACEALTYDSETGSYYVDKFIEDQIHLTHEARLEWRDNYILPVLKDLQ